MALTARQRQFVLEYLIDLNATQAAVRAGYAVPTANREGSRLLSNVDVQAALADAMRERSLRCKMEADEVLLRLARLARADMRDYAEWGPAGVVLKASATMPGEATSCVAEVSQTKEGLRFKLHDSVKALELCGKHLGLFPDRLRVEGGRLDVVVELVGHVNGAPAPREGPAPPRTNGVLA